MENSIPPASVLKKASYTAWLLFGLGISLVPIGVIVWTGMTGVSWWTSPQKKLADEIQRTFLMVAFAICSIAPFFARVSFLRKLGMAGVAALSVMVVQFVCGVIHLILYGV